MHSGSPKCHQIHVKNLNFSQMIKSSVERKWWWCIAHQGFFCCSVFGFNLQEFARFIEQYSCQVHDSSDRNDMFTCSTAHKTQLTMTASLESPITSSSCLPATTSLPLIVVMCFSDYPLTITIPAVRDLFILYSHIHAVKCCGENQRPYQQVSTGLISPE